MSDQLTRRAFLALGALLGCRDAAYLLAPEVVAVPDPVALTVYDGDVIASTWRQSKAGHLYSETPREWPDAIRIDARVTGLVMRDNTLQRDPGQQTERR